MAQIVGGFTVPHTPMIVMEPGAVNARQGKICWDAFATVRQRVSDLAVDTIIVIGDDHYSIFGPHCLPAFLIGIGDVDGPIEPWLRQPKTRIENNEPLAYHIMRHGQESGVDWACAKALTVDHSIYVPWKHAIAEVGDHVRTIPVYISSGVEPLVPNRRAYQVGQAIAAAIEAWDGDERVAIYASGGGAHWPGMGKWEDLNPEWDAELVAKLIAGDAEAIIAMSDDDVFRDGGNGGWELKNWICMMGALGACTGDIIANEPVYDWLGACTYVEMKRAA